MHTDAVAVRVRAVSELGTDADRADPRTPEQRAARIGKRLTDHAWQSLRGAALASLAALLAVIALPSPMQHASALVLLSAATVVAALAFTRLILTAKGRRIAMGFEALLAAAGAGALALSSEPFAVGIALVCLSAGPLTRFHLPAGLHLGLVTAALAVPAASAGAWPLLALCALVAALALCIRLRIRHAREAAMAHLDVQELSALCAQLAGAQESVEP